MIGPAPEFVNSKYFVKDPDWHLKDGASEKDKRELEKFMNSPEFGYPEEWKQKFPKMKKPYYTWSGKMVDKG